MNDSTKINDILKNPLFSDIGQFLFNFYSITNNMTQKNVDYLLPYHSHIEVSTTLEVLEYLEKQKQKRNMKKLYPLWNLKNGIKQVNF